MKKFISFLGTGNYQPCKYTLKESTSESVVYIQDALTEFLCRDFSCKDEIVMYLTYAYNDILPEKERKDWNTKNEDETPWADDLRAYLETKEEFLKWYNQMREKRNDINHGGYKTNVSKASKMRNKIKELSDQLGTLNDASQFKSVLPELDGLLNHEPK